uniref:RAD50-interacting protein 1 n=1 Tax=Diabrotica virgifera virgifera TaxID=50390 RepID=A0A6P7FPX9_DIAVI
MYLEPDPEIKRNVIHNLNQEYGKALLDVNKCLELRNKLLQERKEIEEQLDISNSKFTIGASIKEGEVFLQNTADVVNRSKDVVSKIKTDLEEIQEVRTEIKNYFDKLNTLQCTLQYFKVVQRIEGLRYATEKMDAMLPPNSIEAFDPLTSDVEDLKITTCADAFITLLQTITERYESLYQPGHRLQFLDLQLELLDDFRVRLLQLVNAEEGDIIESRIPAIANSIYYIENVLIDWGTTVHYLGLYRYKSQLEIDKQPSSPALSDFDDDPTCDKTDTVFAETLSLYTHMRKDLLHTLAETVIAEVKVRSKSYRCESWLMMKAEKEFRSLSLTPAACPMFEILSKRLHQLQKSLQSQIFVAVWRSIAQQLDSYLFEDLVLDNRFSVGGALQFKFDITRNLIPLFLQFSERPQNYFTQVIESCNLLNLSKGSALLLRETLLALEGATGIEDTRGKTLKELGVSYFTPKMAVRILNQRADITVNRIIID